MEDNFPIQIVGKDNVDKIPEIIPIVPLRGTILYPGTLLPLAVTRKPSMDAINKALISDKLVGFIGQKDLSVDLPKTNALYSYGCVGYILKMLRFSDGTQRVLVQGLKRFKVEKFIKTNPIFEAKIEVIEPFEEKTVEIEALMRNAIGYFSKFASLIPNFPEELQISVLNINSPGRLADVISTNINLSYERRQELLETIPVKERLIKIMEWLNQEIQVLELGTKIQDEVESELGKSQRDFFLREQLKAIRRELGEETDASQDHEGIKKQILEAKMPVQAEEHALRELKNLSRMHQNSAEYSVSRNYLDWMISLPWSKATKDDWDLIKTEEQLNKDHYGLEKVKERILEFLAVRKLKNDMKGPILCLIGPPGVGKTSVGKSIATSLGKKFARISLGGVHDEAEIRGHRRTYVGSLPGRILQALRKTDVNNPVIMLDEIDKLGKDFRGDPSSALLEVLDPEQNNTFTDHYLDTEFDLSKVLFIATANVADTIPDPLRDRMETISISGYTLEEKIIIAENYLIPKEKEATGLEKRKINFETEALTKLITDYTREAGVRQLSLMINSVCRKIARSITENKKPNLTIKAKNLEKMFGPSKYFNEIIERISVPGVATGLAWTSVGGDILFIEANKMDGKDTLTLTGQLGEVMQESARAALSYLKSNSHKLEIPEDFFEKHNIHIHFPAGAVPKDGPSAGITIAVTLYSLIKDKIVPPNIAMTGEITIKGKVLPVGGIKEKVLAAKRAGITKIILPKRNKAELLDVKERYLEGINFSFVENINEVFNEVFS